MIHDTCDYCFREFGYESGEKPVCMNCGRENARPAKPITPIKRETAMLETPQNAMQSRPKPRGRKR